MFSKNSIELNLEDFSSTLERTNHSEYIIFFTSHFIRVKCIFDHIESLSLSDIFQKFDPVHICFEHQNIVLIFSFLFLLLWLV